MSRKKDIEPLPEEFGSLEEAAEFWGSHDTMDYAEAFSEQTLEVQGELHRRHWEVEVDEDLIPALRDRASKTGVSIQRMVSELLRRQLLTSS
jgi:predicted DNA binding CopG/RHH family protein